MADYFISILYTKLKILFTYQVLIKTTVFSEVFYESSVILDCKLSWAENLSLYMCSSNTIRLWSVGASIMQILDNANKKYIFKKLYYSSYNINQDFEHVAPTDS